jgi:DNA-binding XRE family transcriptional regulator
MIFGIGFPLESVLRTENPMLLTQLPKRREPEAGERASGFGVADQPISEGQLALENLRRERVDDTLGMVCLHERIMPSNLARVKTSECRLPQISWHGTLQRMADAEKPYADIAERIRWHRSLLGLEQKEYAEKANLKRSQLSNWESGDYRLSLDGARALRITYGLSLDFMFEGIDDALSMTLRMAWRDRPAVKSSK